MKLEPGDLGLTPGWRQGFSPRPDNPGGPTSGREKRSEWELVAGDAEEGRGVKGGSSLVLVTLRTPKVARGAVLGGLRAGAGSCASGSQGPPR